MIGRPVDAESVHQFSGVHSPRYGLEPTPQAREGLGRLGVGNHVQRPALRQGYANSVQQFQVTARPADRTPHALCDGAQLAQVWREQREDTVRLAQGGLPQHDGLGAVCSVARHQRSSGGRREWRRTRRGGERSPKCVRRAKRNPVDLRWRDPGSVRQRIPGRHLRAGPSRGALRAAPSGAMRR